MSALQLGVWVGVIPEVCSVPGVTGICQRERIWVVVNAWGRLSVYAGEVLLHLPRHSQGVCQVRRGSPEVDQAVHGDQRHQPEEVRYRCRLREVPRA